MARRLILMRHAQAASMSPSGDDADRPLTPAGRADAARVAAALARSNLAPARAFVSSAARTRQTWEALGFRGAEADFSDALYNADSRRLLGLAEDLAEEASDETVVIIGHNPGIHAAAVELLTRASAAPSTLARLERGFPPATAVAFVVDAAGRMEYDGLYLAGDLGGVAGE